MEVGRTPTPWFARCEWIALGFPSILSTIECCTFELLSKNYNVSIVLENSSSRIVVLSLLSRLSCLFVLDEQVESADGKNEYINTNQICPK